MSRRQTCYQNFHQVEATKISSQSLMYFQDFPLPTRYPILEPLFVFNMSSSKLIVANAIVDIMTTHAYLPILIITDKGSIFVSNKNYEIVEVLGITIHHATKKHAKTIGLLARTHATVKTSLKMSSLDKCSQLAIWQPKPNKLLILMTDANFQAARYAVFTEDDPKQKVTSARKTYDPVTYSSKMFTASRTEMYFYDTELSAKANLSTDRWSAFCKKWYAWERSSLQAKNFAAMCCARCVSMLTGWLLFM